MMRDVQTDEISRRPLAGLRGWLISTGMAGMDVQTRGVARSARPRLRDEARRADGYLEVRRALGAGGAVGALRAAGLAICPAVARYRHLARTRRRPLHAGAAATGGLCNFHGRDAGSQDRARHGRHDLGAGSRSAARTQRIHDAHRAAQLHGKAPGRAAAHDAARHRRTPAPARLRHPWRQERRLQVPRRGRRAAGAARCARSGGSA